MKGTAETLNAKPTKIKTIAKIAPIFCVVKLLLIFSKFQTYKDNDCSSRPK